MTKFFDRSPRWPLSARNLAAIAPVLFALTGLMLVRQRFRRLSMALTRLMYAALATS